MEDWKRLYRWWRRNAGELAGKRMTTKDLVPFLERDPQTQDLAPLIERVGEVYPVLIPPYITEQMENPGIFRQFFPLPGEMTTLDGENPDPIGDGCHEAVKGIVHRYPGRVLFKVTGECRGICRFCFRRGLLHHGEGELSANEIRQALDYVRETKEVHEVILSGGDPLVLASERIGEILKALSEMKHLDFIRIHTRLPLLAPREIDRELLALFKKWGPLLMVIHCNHPGELTEEAGKALERLAASGVQLFSQSVLLKGINDSLPVLEKLFRGLLKRGVKPYYLHHPDLSPGTGAFRVSIKKGMALSEGLRGLLPGHCQPLYILDIPGGFGKVPANLSYLTEEGAGLWNVRDLSGRKHFYRDI